MDSTVEHFHSSGFFGLRTSLLPVDAFLAWSEGLQNIADGSPEQREARWRRNRRRLRARLLRRLESPGLSAALCSASPQLWQGLRHWRREPDGRKGRSVEASLISYFSRMSARPTPFGCLAGWSIGQFSSKSDVFLEARARYRRHTQIDMWFLWELVEDLARGPLSRSAPLVPSSSLFKTADRYCFVAFEKAEGGRSFGLKGIEASEAVSRALAEADGGRTWGELRDVLAADLDVGAEDAADFVDRLVRAQVLVPALEAPITGEAGSRGVVTVLRRLASAPRSSGGEVETQIEALVEALEEVDRLLAVDDAEAWRQTDVDDHIKTEPFRSKPRESDDPVQILERLRRWAKALPGSNEGGEALSFLGPDGVERESKAHEETSGPRPSYFRVDLTKPLKGKALNADLVREVAKGIDVLRRLTGNPAQKSLERFCFDFVRRYGEGAERPLAEVLDEEVGIGFGAYEGQVPSGLLQGLRFPPPEPDLRVVWGPWERLNLKLCERAWVRGTRSVEILDHEIPELEVPPLPDAFHAVVSLAARSVEAVDRGQYKILLKSAFGPSGSRLFSHFTRLDSEAREKVEGHLRQEEALDPDAVYAEVTHLPEGRFGQVATRPRLRPYEIPYLGSGEAPKDYQIPISDLWVSVTSGRVILRSRRLGKRVVPRLTAPFQLSPKNLPIYRFLCTVQTQARLSRGLFWHWGPSAESRFLPRVTYGRVVLARARWSVSDRELESVLQKHGAERFQATTTWHRERRMPRLLVMCKGDQELLVDFRNVLSVESFLATVIKDRKVRMEEIFPDPENLTVHGPEGRFVHELVIPFVRRRPLVDSQAETAGETFPLLESGNTVSRFDLAKTAHVQASAAPQISLDRRHASASDWLYVKLHGGPAFVDRLVRRHLFDWAEELKPSCDRWFFVRYGDPDWHLRLRFQGAGGRPAYELMPQIEAWAHPHLRLGGLRKIDLGVYRPEWERYGGEAGMAVSETWFHIDSEAVLGLTAVEEHPDERWIWTLVGCDRLLSDLGWSLPAKIQVVKRIKELLGRQLRVDAPFRKQMAARLRLHRRRLDSLLDPAGRVAVSVAASCVLDRRSRRLEAVVANLRDLERRGVLTVSLLELTISYLHMFCNRMLVFDGKRHEVVIYDFLERLYSSRLARERALGARIRQCSDPSPRRAEASALVSEPE